MNDNGLENCHSAISAKLRFQSRPIHRTLDFILVETVHIPDDRPNPKRRILSPFCRKFRSNGRNAPWCWVRGDASYNATMRFFCPTAYISKTLTSERSFAELIRLIIPPHLAGKNTMAQGRSQPANKETNWLQTAVPSRKKSLENPRCKANRKLSAAQATGRCNFLVSTGQLM